MKIEQGGYLATTTVMVHRCMLASDPGKLMSDIIRIVYSNVLLFPYPICHRLKMTGSILKITSYNLISSKLSINPEITVSLDR